MTIGSRDYAGDDMAIIVVAADGQVVAHRPLGGGLHLSWAQQVLGEFVAGALPNTVTVGELTLEMLGRRRVNRDGRDVELVAWRRPGEAIARFDSAADWDAWHAGAGKSPLEELTAQAVRRGENVMDDRKREDRREDRRDRREDEREADRKPGGGRPDQGLPGEQPGIDNELPPEGGHPDQGLPGEQPKPDQGLPGSQPKPDQGLPGEQPGVDNTLPGSQPKPDQGLPGNNPNFNPDLDPDVKPGGPKPDQGLPPTAQPKE